MARGASHQTDDEDRIEPRGVLIAVAGADFEAFAVAVGHGEAIGKERQVEQPALEYLGDLHAVVGVEKPAALAERMAHSA